MTKFLKKILPLVPILSFLLLCPVSCSGSGTGTVYFIRAVGAIEENGKTKAVFLAQKQSAGKKSEFLTLTSYGGDIDKAAKKLDEKYGNCYFATNRLYIIPKDADLSFITSVSRICDSGVLPSACSVVCADKNDIEQILNDIDDGEKLKKLMSFCKSNSGQRDTAIHFFAKSLSRNGFSKVPCIQRAQNGSVKGAKSVILPFN